MQANLHDAISNIEVQKPANSRRQRNKNAEGIGGEGERESESSRHHFPEKQQK
jgi:hypothetical protein